MRIPGYATLEAIENEFQVQFVEKSNLKEVLQAHPMFIPAYYAELIDWQDPEDPLKKIVFPSVEELDLSGSYDTSGEMENTVLTGLQHKYRETVLLLVTNRCAGYCRHCFRKRMVGISTQETLQIFDQAVDYIKNHPEVTNVLISGGDPLVLKTEVIEHFLKELSQIPHLRFIRFGSRVPVYYPMRIYEDQKLLEVFATYSTPERRIYLVTHFNHPRELTEEAKRAVDALLRHRVIVGNQTVLLKGVNDDPETLAELMKSLVSTGVVPYYVFQCRPVKRVKSKFQVPIVKGYSIVEKAKQQLDGHAKRFKYVMSHRTGKVEILGILDGYVYFKYHQCKDPEKVGVLFRRPLVEEGGWLDDFPPLPDDPAEEVLKNYSTSH
jgi:KamA family protein